MMKLMKTKNIHRNNNLQIFISPFMVWEDVGHCDFELCDLILIRITKSQTINGCCRGLFSFFTSDKITKTNLPVWRKRGFCENMWAIHNKISILLKSTLMRHYKNARSPKKTLNYKMSLKDFPHKRNYFNWTVQCDTYFKYSALTCSYS